eukprot:3526338-Rhodomonas_salina.1
MPSSTSSKYFTFEYPGNQCEIQIRNSRRNSYTSLRFTPMLSHLVFWRSFCIRVPGYPADNACVGCPRSWTSH